MKYLKIFEDFGDIDSICRKYNITNYTINSDGSIDVNGDVNLDGKGLVKIPLKFREVSGNFYCSDNQLTILEGSPQTVGRDFYCNHNKLTSLEGSSLTVGGNFYCGFNQLTSLEGSSLTVGGNFYCGFNQLTSLEGSSLTVDGDFDCQYNQLTSLEGSPQSIGGAFVCRNNPVENIWNLFKDYSKVELFNDYDPVRDGGVIILDRLNAFLQDIGKPEVTEVKGYKCI